MSRARLVRAGLGAVVACGLGSIVPLALRAQQPVPTVAPELRVDVIAARRTSVQGGVGLEIPFGYYTRIGVIAGVGARVDSASSATGRLDLVARFLLDPFRQSRWGLSAGGGVSLRAASGDRVRPQLVVVADLEGPRSAHGFSPAVQIGLGGGFRAGVVVRFDGRTTR